MANAEFQAKSTAQHQGTPLWEYVLGAIGALFLIGIIGFLIYEALQPTTPPDIVVTAEETVVIDGGYLVEIRAENVGTSTGATVEIEGTLRPSDDPTAAPVEVSTTTFDYVPAHSTRRGGLFFQADPNQYQLEVRALGYIDP